MNVLTPKSTIPNRDLSCDIKQAHGGIIPHIWHWHGWLSQSRGAEKLCLTSDETAGLTTSFYQPFAVVFFAIGKCVRVNRSIPRN